MYGAVILNDELDPGRMTTLASVRKSKKVMYNGTVLLWGSLFWQDCKSFKDSYLCLHIFCEPKKCQTIFESQIALLVLQICIHNNGGTFSIKVMGPGIFPRIFPLSFLPVLDWKTIEKTWKISPNPLNMKLNIGLKLMFSMIKQNTFESYNSLRQKNDIG